MHIVEEIGKPALLEQCAEECAELAHACLKMSRKLRDENPTPADMDAITASLIEEMADVYLCIFEIAMLYDEGIDMIQDIRKAKLKRWENRIEDHKNEEDESPSRIFYEIGKSLSERFARSVRNDNQKGEKYD